MTKYDLCNVQAKLLSESGGRVVTKLVWMPSVFPAPLLDLRSIQSVRRREGRFASISNRVCEASRVVPRARLSFWSALPISSRDVSAREGLFGVKHATGIGALDPRRAD